MLAGTLMRKCFSEDDDGAVKLTQFLSWLFFSTFTESLKFQILSTSVLFVCVT